MQNPNIAEYQKPWEDYQLDVCSEFPVNIVKRIDGRYEVGVPWLPGAKLSNTNEMARRIRSRTTSKNSGEMKNWKSSLRR